MTEGLTLPPLKAFLLMSIGVLVLAFVLAKPTRSRGLSPVQEDEGRYSGDDCLPCTTVPVMVLLVLLLVKQ